LEGSRYALLLVRHRRRKPLKWRRDGRHFATEPILGSPMILHVDMDAFYASVEERDRPQLAGQPVIVGGTPQGRGVVAAANYVVRKFGVHSAMPTARALQLCPEAIVLPPRMDYYAEVSRQIRQIFDRYTPLVEPLSLDEAFLDVRGSEKLFGPAPGIGRRIKQDIKRELRLVASVGVAPNKFLAKIASDLQKPDGFLIVEPGRVQEFLDPLPIGRLWGVGRAAEGVLERLGVRTIGQLRAEPVELVRQHFGKAGDHLWELAHGVDERPVVPDREAKSISHETTFATDIEDLEVLRAWLLELTEQVARRLRRHQLRGRTVQLKLRFADFCTITRSRTLAQATNVTMELWRAADELLIQRLPRRQLEVRLLGMGVSGFDGSGQQQRMLFDEEGHQKQTQLDAVTDQIREQYGPAGLGRASTMLHGARHRPQPRPGDPI
jgi:DNA polymerase-4